MPCCLKSQFSPLALYVHFPYCHHICPYCHLHKSLNHAIDENRLLNAYEAQLSHLAAHVPLRPVTSIFFGGGTPSLMSESMLANLLKHISHYCDIHHDAEITCEFHPSHHEKLASFKAAGITRVSIAAEAMTDKGLKKLGRPYDTSTIITILQKARKLYDHVSCDFIHSRPHQTLAEWQEELRAIIAIGCDHLSLYELTLDGGSVFGKQHAQGILKAHSESEARQFYDETHKIMTAAGYHQYEISNYARDHHESRHNLSYWRYEPSIAIGASGAGRMDTSDGARIALRAICHAATWLEAVEQGDSGYDEWHTLSATEMAREIFLTQLRLSEGISLTRLQALTGNGLDQWCDMTALRHLQNGGWLTLTSTHLRLTHEGRAVFNEVLAHLLL